MPLLYRSILYLRFFILALAFTLIFVLIFILAVAVVLLGYRHLQMLSSACPETMTPRFFLSFSKDAFLNWPQLVGVMSHRAGIESAVIAALFRFQDQALRQTASPFDAV